MAWNGVGSDGQTLASDVLWFFLCLPLPDIRLIVRVRAVLKPPANRLKQKYMRTALRIGSDQLRVNWRTPFSGKTMNGSRAAGFEPSAHGPYMMQQEKRWIQFHKTKNITFCAVVNGIRLPSISTSEDVTRDSFGFILYAERKDNGKHFYTVLSVTASSFGLSFFSRHCPTSNETRKVRKSKRQKVKKQ